MCERYRRVRSHYVFIQWVALTVCRDLNLEIRNLVSQSD